MLNLDSAGLFAMGAIPIVLVAIALITIARAFYKYR